MFRYDPICKEWNQEAKLTASDAATDDRFGISVSVSGDVAVVGAAYDSDAGVRSGSMYVFRFDGFDWNEQGRFTASDASIFDNFGISVSVSGEQALVGAQAGEGLVNNSGAAYLFTGLGDCNDTDTSDICDILNGLSEDCCADGGANGIPDQCEEECRADLFEDGVVDSADLAELLAVWGPCLGCPADFDFDCDVDSADLAYLLSNWGECPRRPSSVIADLQRRFAQGGGDCLSLEEALAILGFSSVQEFIDWILSIFPNQAHAVAQVLLWVLTNWPC